jgi:sec-independent protein translocase protein TatB
MLFDIAWPEFLLIGVVALVVIGPKDLPAALRVAGQWVRKARTLSREFHSSVEQMIRDAELDEMHKELKKATEINIEHEMRKTVDPTGSLAESLSPPEVPDFFDKPPVTFEPELVEPVEPVAETASEETAGPGLPVAKPPPVHGFEPPDQGPA